VPEPAPQPAGGSDKNQREAEEATEEHGDRGTVETAGGHVNGTEGTQQAEPSEKDHDQRLAGEPGAQRPEGRRDHADHTRSERNPAQPPRDEGVQQPNRPPDWLVSHAHIGDDANDGSEPADPETARRRQEVDRAGIACVLVFEREQGRTPEEMPPNHPGYDIESQDSEGRPCYIEVKSLSNGWTPANPVALTAIQFDKARELGDRYWLYVVEHALDDERRLIRIQDPANRVVRFYFDSGWKAVSNDAISEESP